MQEDYFLCAQKKIEEGNTKLLYVRHMIPSLELIDLLKKAKKSGINVLYEIPTYPYFYEQIKASRRKYRAVVKIGLDILFWPIIYKYINELVVIKSNTNARMYSKMVEITNGIMVDDIRSKQNYKKREANTFSMVTVGTLYPYHGYDRILKVLKKCNEKIGDVKVELHIV